jgi:hypothetical protein
LGYLYESLGKPIDCTNSSKKRCFLYFGITPSLINTKDLLIDVLSKMLVLKKNKAVELPSEKIFRGKIITKAKLLNFFL